MAPMPSTAARSEYRQKEINVKRLDAIWTLITRVFWIVVFGGCIAVFLALFIPRYSQYNRLNQRIREMNETNRELEAAVRRLEMRQQRFVSDPAFVERTAREIGMARPNETIYKYYPDESTD